MARARMGKVISVIGSVLGLSYILVVGTHAKVHRVVSPSLGAGERLSPRSGQPDTSLLAEAVQVSVKEYGALGNGLADDTVAIQKALTAVALKGGGTVFFPAGTYRISIQPRLGRALTLSRNLTLQGEGTAKSILRLSDRQGNYNAILAGASNSTDLSNLVIKQLTLDANGTNNPVSTEAVFRNQKERYMLRVYVGRKIRIEQCRWTNFRNVNALTLNNDQMVSDVVIQNNQFDGAGGGLADFDHSTIYVHGKRSLIANNTFTSSKGAGTVGARTAIETHGDAHRVLNNQISGYTYGMNITGVASSSKHQIVQGNKIKGVHTGILIWSFQTRESGGRPGLENLVIDQNQIDIDVAGWRRLWGDSPNQGIALEANSNAAIHTLKITNNTITFRNVKDPGRASDTLAAGIILWKLKPPNLFSKDIWISKNTITSPLSSGLYMGIPIQGLHIMRNTVLNTGQSGYAFHPHYRSGMVIGVDKVSMQVNDNQLMNTLPQNTMPVGMIWSGTCSTNCTQRNNRLVIRSGAKVPLLLQTPTSLLIPH